MSSFWTSALQARANRRRALIATGAGALGAAFLAACGGSGNSNKTPVSTDNSGLVYAPVDTTGQAKAGGVLKLYGTLDAVQGLDALQSNNVITLNPNTFTYMRLLKFGVEKYPKLAASQTVQGDLAESYELSPDKLTLTMKIRQGIKWDPRPPTSGRILDVQDVMFSWNKFIKVHPNRAELHYDAQTAKTAPVDSLSSPDSSTIVFKLKSPNVSLLPMLASLFYLYIVPRESDGGFDPRSDMRGSGPFLLDEYTPSVRFVWRRNPDYYLKGQPLPDRVEQPIVPEYAARLSQFRSGNIFTSVVTQDDVIQTKKDLPDTLLLQAEGYPAIGGMTHLGFGYEGDSPWKDQRMRQALSMVVNRDTMTDTVYNGDRFRSQGYPVDTAHNTFLLPGFVGAWLDPTNQQAFGPNAKYLNYDVAEAKKLMAAAGNANGAEVKLFSVPAYPPPSPKIIEIFAGMFSDAGFKVTQVTLTASESASKDYYGAYTARDANGKAPGYNGVWQAIKRSGPTVASTFYSQLHKDSGDYLGVSPDGRNVEQGDPMLNQLIEKMIIEFDDKKQQALAQDAQRLVAGQAYVIPNSGSIKTFGVSWPAIGNMGVSNSYGSPAPGGTGVTASWAEPFQNWWVDSSKAPLSHS